jgi:hypothetical protein
MISIVISSTVPIANEQAKRSEAQAQAPSQNTQSPQTVHTSNSSQSPASQSSGSSSAVRYAPSYTTIAEMTGTVTSAAPWHHPNLSSSDPSNSTLSSNSASDPSAASYVSHVPQQQHQYQTYPAQHQPLYEPHYTPPNQQPMSLNTPTSHSVGGRSQPPPASSLYTQPRPQDNTRRSNTH